MYFVQFLYFYLGIILLYMIINFKEFVQTKIKIIDKFTDLSTYIMEQYKILT